jgi:hypothetical protein
MGYKGNKMTQFPEWAYGVTTGSHNSDIMSGTWPTGLECGVQDLDVHICRAIDNRIHRLDRLANNSTGSMHGPCAWISTNLCTLSNGTGKRWTNVRYERFDMHTLIESALSNNSKNVFNLISDEAFSWPNNTKEMALKRQLPSPLTTIGVESDHCWPSNCVAIWSPNRYRYMNQMTQLSAHILER